MSETEHTRILETLRDLSIPFEEFEHEAVRTSAEAAAVRGSQLNQGVKSLLVKFRRATAPGKEFFAIINLPAHRKLDFKKAKKVLQASDVTFANEDEVHAETGCEPGGVPPFGYLKTLAILVDPSIFENEHSEFNAGLKTKSVRLKSAGFKRALDSIGVAYFSLVQ